MLDYENEDVGNIVQLEHVNLQVPDQTLATVFYIVGLGLTRDPYFNVGVRNMWANAGEQQFHLPVRPAQVIHGHVGMVVPSLDALKERLASVEEPLVATKFSWSATQEYVAVTCPWGNCFRCYAAQDKFGDMALGIPYIEFLVERGCAPGIARFYRQALSAPASIEDHNQEATAHVKIGRNQWLIFRESDRPVPIYDGHHIAIYVANFSQPYAYLQERGLVTEAVRNYQFRFKEVRDPDSGRGVFVLEHEVRSMYHPMFHRVMANRNAEESARRYRRGRDALVPYR